MTKRITIVDIAKETGFSVSAVSKALTDADDISNETKEIIKKKCLELGYIRNINASSLKKGNSRIIGILYDSFLNPFYNEMVYYLEILLKELNYSIITYRSNEFDMEIFNNIIARSAEGVISFLTPTDDVLKKIKDISFPVVITGRYSKDISSVYIDDEHIGQLAAKYALTKNVKKPMYIGESIDLPIVTRRCLGFEEELKKHNIVIKSHMKTHYVSNQIFLNSIDQDELLETDCFFCFNDSMAFDLLAHLSKLNIKNPLIIGVDCIQDEILVPVSMVSIGVDKNKMSEAIVDLLIELIAEHIKAAQHIVIDARLKHYNF